MRSRTLQNWMYLFVACSTFLLPTGGLLLLGRTNWFLDHSDYPRLMIIGYGQGLQNANCQILIYGDSSALVGLDPAIFERDTGLKTCNIAEGTTVQRIVGTDLPLRNYLAHNTPPRILVTTWTPTIFKPDQPPLQKYTVEGMWYAWRFGTWQQLLTLQGFRYTMAFVGWEWDNLYTTVRELVENQVAVKHTYRADRAAKQGQWPYPDPPQTHCTRSYAYPDAVRDQASVEAFRRKYSTSVTRVIVDITPVPTCDAQFANDERQLRGLYDNTLLRYPINDYNNGDVHLNPQGAKLYSAVVAAQVKVALDSQ